MAKTPKPLKTDAEIEELWKKVEDDATHSLALAKQRIQTGTSFYLMLARSSLDQIKCALERREKAAAKPVL